MNFAMRAHRGNPAEAALHSLDTSLAAAKAAGSSVCLDRNSTTLSTLISPFCN